MTTEDPRIEACIHVMRQYSVLNRPSVRELLAAADAVDPTRAALARVLALCDEIHGHGADLASDEIMRLRQIIERISAAVGVVNPADTADVSDVSDQNRQPE